MTVVRLRGESGEVGMGESARAIMDSEIHGVYLHRRVRCSLTPFVINGDAGEHALPYILYGRR